MDNGKSLFATLAAIDPKWAVVEYNTADLRSPQGTPTYAAAYRSLRDLWNFGARYVSPMAWNGSNGINAGKPGFSNFTAWRNTPLEEAARDFMLARAGLPPGTPLWTFGTPAHEDGDGWTPDVGAIRLGHGLLRLEPDRNRRVAIVSPAELPEAAGRAETFVLGLEPDAGLRRVRIQGRRTAESGWETLADAISADNAGWRHTAAGVVIGRTGIARPERYTQVRIELTFAATTTRALTRVALLP
jgi:hypothetical protein